MTPAPISVERLRELLDRATPGPWIAWENSFSRWQILGGRGVLAGIATPNDPASPPDSWGECEVNAALIAEAITALPALLHQLAEREAEVRRLKSDVAMYEHANEIGLGTIKAGQQFIDAMANDLRAVGCDVDFNRTPIVANPRAEAAERARDEACGLLREVLVWRRTVPPIAETPRKDGGIFGRIAAFLAASGGKVDG